MPFALRKIKPQSGTLLRPALAGAFSRHKQAQRCADKQHRLVRLTPIHKLARYRIRNALLAVSTKFF